MQALLTFVALSPGCGLRRLRLDGNPLGGKEGVVAMSRILLGQQPQQTPVPSLQRLEMLELRRVRVWEGTDAVAARDAVVALVQALLRPGKAPALRRLVLGVEATRGVNAEGQEGKGGYLPLGTMKEIQALLARHRQQLPRQYHQWQEDALRQWLEVTAEGGSPFMGLDF